MLAVVHFQYWRLFHSLRCSRPARCRNSKPSIYIVRRCRVSATQASSLTTSWTSDFCNFTLNRSKTHKLLPAHFILISTMASKGGAYCSRRTFVICFAVSGVILLVLGLVSRFVFSYLIKDKVDEVSNLNKLRSLWNTMIYITAAYAVYKL